MAGHEVFTPARVKLAYPTDFLIVLRPCKKTPLARICCKYGAVNCREVLCWLLSRAELLLLLAPGSGPLGHRAGCALGGRWGRLAGAVAGARCGR